VSETWWVGCVCVQPSSTTQDPTKDGIPALQAKLQMLREATASASASEL
jgi:hypothetical protein